MSGDYLLRAEGVNLDTVLGDTNQLSVIRGSGLMLRDSVRCLVHHLRGRFKDTHFNEVSRDASAVVLGFRADENRMTEVTEESIHYFRKQYKDFTFVVDTTDATGNFINDQQQLKAKNRLRQIQQPSLALVDWNTHFVENNGVCEVGGIRPNAQKPIVDKQASLSVYRRFEYGRTQRSEFYKNELGDQVNALKFTDDLKSLSESHQHGNLNDKVAVLYWDGNGFGSIQSRIVKTAEDKKAFDDEIQERHRAFLEVQIQDALKDINYQTSDQRLRMETLLWGGDEILLVVPACCGFDTLMRFYEVIKKWSYQGESMTYSCGVVFSQANTPISRLTQLAKNLAESNKLLPDTKLQNRFDYVTLESMDFPSEPLNVLRERQYHLAADNRQNLHPLDSLGMTTLARVLINSDFPKSKLIELAKVYASEGKEAAEAVKERILHVIGKDNMERVEIHIKALFKQPDEYWNWLHLAELWDYLIPWGDRQDG